MFHKKAISWNCKLAHLNQMFMEIDISGIEMLC